MSCALPTGFGLDLHRLVMRVKCPCWCVYLALARHPCAANSGILLGSLYAFEKVQWRIMLTRIPAHRFRSGPAGLRLAGRVQHGVTNA